MASPPSTLYPALHTDLQLMDELGRALVRGADEQVAAAGNAPIDKGTGGRDQFLDRRLEREPTTFCLAQECRRDLREPRYLFIGPSMTQNTRNGKPWSHPTVGAVDVEPLNRVLRRLGAHILMRYVRPNKRRKAHRCMISSISSRRARIMGPIDEQ